MYTNRKGILALAFFVSIVIAFTRIVIPSVANELTNEDTLTDQNSWVSLKEGYDYPIDALDEEWKEFTSVEEMRKVTQIPEEILEKISTNELILLVLRYPLLCDIHAYDTLEDGYEHLREQFNGIQELLVREDAFENLIVAYNAYSICEQKILDYDILLDEENYVDQLNSMMMDDYYRALILQDGKVLETIDVLEMLLKDILESSGSRKDMELFAEVYIEKMTEKNISEYYENVNPAELLNVLKRNNSELLDVFCMENEAEINQTEATIYIYTPSGKSVKATYYVEYEYDDISRWMSLIESYNATLISSAQSTFNCHSFAWLHNLYPDRYLHIWLNYATEFVNDSAYTKLTRNTAKAETIVYYSGNVHSAVATGVRGTNQYGGMELYVVSKWGRGPMVKHLESCCPYYYNDIRMEYYYLEED